MNLLQALEITAQSVPQGNATRTLFLACGFTPLHLSTFIDAHLLRLQPQQNNEFKAGVYGDLAGNLLRAASSAGTDTTIIVVEWPDIDARLGVRALGGWRSEDVSNILSSAQAQLFRLRGAILRVAENIPTILCLPSLPLPPLFYTRSDQSPAEQLQLNESVASFAASLVNIKSLRVLNVQKLSAHSPLSARFDVKSEILTGFPYSLSHASALAAQIAQLLVNPTPKKGLITDLDDTLWAGILGEVGVSGISWNLDQHSHMHGLYQQFLASLASAGVLLAVASKNDSLLVQKAFERKDLLLSRDCIFPFEVHWNRKSESVQRILEGWNISPDAVVFIDDSPMEVAEVKTAFPSIEGIVFPKSDYLAIWQVLHSLRDLFGKPILSAEDSLRLQSLRQMNAQKESLVSLSADDFLRTAGARIQFTLLKDNCNPRALELVNKTNQFNLNGKRFTEGEWVRYLQDPNSFLVIASYTDKFGPLGRIAVMVGKRFGQQVRLDSWVMSCRAFSRRIEFQCLKYIFEKFDVTDVEFDFQPTDRNYPLQECLKEILGAALHTNSSVSRADFLQRIPSLFHGIEESTNEPS
jgi:FkbH-like protein